MPEPFELTVAEAAEKIRSGELTSVGLVESLLQRNDRLEPALNAWVTLDREELLNNARDRDTELSKTGPKGPLHGVPMGFKDIFYTAGIKTTACSKIYADFVPTYDATCVARLKEAGAVTMGKLVTTEFACTDTKPLEPGAYPRGLQQRFRRIGSCANMPCSTGQPDSGFYVQARVL